MKTFKRLISLFLSLDMFISFMFLPKGSNTAMAIAETANTISNDATNEIFYSDLFYGYGSYLNDSSLSEFHLKTQNAMSNVFTEYVNSDAFGWAGFSETLNLFSSMSDLAKAYSDYFGLTDFQYEDDLDAANVKFASQLFELKMDVGDGISDIGKTNSQIKGVISTIKKLFEARENDELILSESITLILSDTATYCEYTATLIPSLNKYVIEYLDKLAEPLDTADEIFDFCSALAVAIAMEDIRISLIEDIIASQEKDTILYEGMTRLRGQLKNGYVGYFVETYLTNKVIDEIAKGVTKNITNILLGSANAVCGAVTSTVGLINDIVFDWILGDSFATIEDYRVTMILSQYSDLLYDGLINKQSEFTKSFAVDQIFSYEVYFDAYLSATRFALEQCVKLTNYNSVYTKEYINGYISICENYSYQQYVANIKNTISSIPFAERRITEFDEWLVDGSTVLKNGTETLEVGCIYFVNGLFSANFKLTNTVQMIVRQNDNLCIKGDITYTGSSGSAYLDVNGELEVTGNIMHGNLGSVRIRMSTPDAVIKVGGNLLHKDGYSEIAEGTIIFSGKTQQRVNHLKAKNITVDNPAGIIYDSIVHLYGHYDPNGNPIDDNGYYTYVYSGATFEEDVYPKLYPQGTIELTTSMTADLYLSSGVIVTIPSGNKTCLDGSITYTGSSGWANLDVNGELEITGDIMHGDLGSVYVRMSNPDAVIKVGGNLLHKSGYSEITEGTIIFNGNTQQRVNQLKAKNITVDNPAGIIYDSIIHLYGHYDPNGNPIDDNGYYTYVYSGATFEDDVYPMLYAKGNIELTTSMTADLYLSTGVVVTIPSGNKMCLDGSITYTGSSGWANLDVNGELEVTGDIMHGDLGSVRIRMSNPDAVIKIGGNFLQKDGYSKITEGTIIFNGNTLQRVNLLKATVIVIDNHSVDGIVFESPISSSALFNHNGNNFSLYADGTGSSFVDYDNDGMRDDKDPYPIIPIGDISDDAVVDTVDRMILSRCLAGWEDYSTAEIEILTADVNGDGVTDTLDRMILSRHLANWEGYETLPYSAQ